MSDTAYSLILSTPYRVGYHLELDEIFLYTVTSDGLFSVFVKGKLDVVFFEEFMSDKLWIELGDL